MAKGYGCAMSDDRFETYDAAGNPLVVKAPDQPSLLDEVNGIILQLPVGVHRVQCPRCEVKGALRVVMGKTSYSLCCYHKGCFLAVDDLWVGETLRRTRPPKGDVYADSMAWFVRCGVNWKTL
jgi:hypothetical protein